jgi:peptidoglycan hydrolase-like protein with peptidoglycan-binding domain
MAAVVDYSFSHPAPPRVKAGGYLGAMRYLGNDFGRGPRCLTIPERDALHAVGLDYGLVWENKADMTLRGGEGGQADAVEANRQADLLGFPPDRPLHAAVDFEPTDDQLSGPIRSYFVAFKAMSRRPVRPYGAARVISYLCATVGISDRGWQTVAWSYGVVSPQAAMVQRFGLVLDNSSDSNDVLMTDWGQDAAPDPDVVIQPAGTGNDHVLEGTVAEVQRLLSVLAEATGDRSIDPRGIDGVWGPRTDAAVREFQAKAVNANGEPLAVDGVVGHQTITALRVDAYVALVAAEAKPKAPAFPGGVLGAPELHPGGWTTGRGEAVQQIQRQLTGLGIPVGNAGADGIFGLATNHAVTVFQQMRGLKADGLVGPRTWAALFA